MDQKNTSQQPSAPTPPPMTPPTPVVPAPQQQESSLSIASMVLGIVSLTGFGFLLGIPAIITGAIALKKHQPGRGLSITGIVTGAISTVVSLLIVGFLGYIFIDAASHPERYQQPERQQQEQYEQVPGQERYQELNT